jgi:hypothetical protein
VTPPRPCVTHARELEALHLVADGFGITLGQPSVLTAAKEGLSCGHLEMAIETGVVYHHENDSLILKAFIQGIKRTRDSYLSEHRRDWAISA